MTSLFFTLALGPQTPVPPSCRSPRHSRVSASAPRVAASPGVALASSAAVYGNIEASPKREDALPRPTSPYALTKWTNEVDAAYFGEYADDKVTEALTPAGIEFLYDAIDRLHIEESPIAPEATHAEVIALADALRTGAAWKGADGAVIARARRMLRHVRDLLNLPDIEST
jgi:hypothetical protein